MWQAAAQATENWWRYWSDAWESLPAQPTAAAPTLCPPAPRRRTRTASAAKQ